MTNLIWTNERRVVKDLIPNPKNPRKISMDLFGGSGSTMVACQQTARRCYSMEISPAYCQVEIDRMEKLFGIKAEKIK